MASSEVCGRSQFVLLGSCISVDFRSVHFTCPEFRSLFIWTIFVLILCFGGSQLETWQCFRSGSVLRPISSPLPVFLEVPLSASFLSSCLSSDVLLPALFGGSGVPSTPAILPAVRACLTFSFWLRLMGPCPRPMHHHQQPSYGGYPGQSYHQQQPQQPQQPQNPYGYSQSPQPPQQPYGSPAPPRGYNVCRDELGK